MSAFLILLLTGNLGAQPSTDEPALWPFLPNWRDQYSIRYEYRTDIFTSRSGKEQRRSQRTTPRRQFTSTVTRDRAEMRRLDRFVYSNQDREIVVPDLLRHVSTTSAMPAGAQQVDIDSVPEWLVVGVSVIFVDGDQQLLRTVVTITGSTVWFDGETPDTWEPETRLHPVVIGRMASDVDVEQITDEVAEVSLSFAATPGIAPINVGSPVEAFNGREILTIPHNWSRGVGGSYNHSVDTVDFGRGRTQTFRPVSFGTRLHQVGFTFGTQAEAQAAVQFFGRMKGQRGEFYMESHANDLIVVAPVAAGGTVLTFDGTDLYDTYAADTVHRAVIITIAGSEYRYSRSIAQFMNTGTQTLIELAVALPVDIDPDRVQVSWLRASRFAVDLLELQATTDAVAQTQLAVKTLEDLSVDDPVWGGLDEAAQWLLNYFGWRFTKNMIADPLDHFVNVTWPHVSESIP